MPNPLANHPPWRQLIIISMVLPLMIVLGVLAFAWPVARLAPRDLPVGIVGTGLIGPAGLGLSAVLMIFVGNPFSGATSAPQLLPTAVGHIGQWLPPGAGASLLRSTAYFSGNGASGHLNVLIIWSVLGLTAIFVGHHAPFQFAASPSRHHQRSGPEMTEHDPASDDWQIARAPSGE